VPYYDWARLESPEEKEAYLDALLRRASEQTPGAPWRRAASSTAAAAGRTQRTLSGVRNRAAAADSSLARLGMLVAKEPKPSASSEVEMYATGQYHQGAVKSYNAVKGFGFITSSGLTDDVFFMRSALPVELESQSLQGCSVTFELAKTPEGKLRALNVTSA